MERPEWYLDIKQIKEIENHNWTSTEMRQVYTLRKTYKLSAKKIADRFGIRVTQVYNTTRLVKRSYNKECFMCGHKLSEEDIGKNKGKFIKACTKCKSESLTYKKERREEFLSKGLCGCCETEKVIPGQTSCKKCISATYRRRYLKNLCGRCGKHPITSESTTLCFFCTEKNKKRSKKNRDKVKA